MAKLPKASAMIVAALLSSLTGAAAQDPYGIGRTDPYFSKTAKGGGSLSRGMQGWASLPSRLPHFQSPSLVAALSDSSSPSSEGDRVSSQLRGDIILEHLHIPSQTCPPADSPAILTSGCGADTSVPERSEAQQVCPHSQAGREARITTRRIG